MPTYYRVRETAREDEIDGLQLAAFSPRAVGFGIDFALVSLLRKSAQFLWDNFVPHQWERHTLLNLPHVLDVERSFGYGASFLELGLGFAQFFIQRNRQCARDRLAETVVIDVRKSATRRVDQERAFPGCTR